MRKWPIIMTGAAALGGLMFLWFSPPRQNTINQPEKSAVISTNETNQTRHRIRRPQNPITAPDTDRASDQSLPRYLGGLEERSALPGMKIRLHARFEGIQPGDRIFYRVDGEQIGGEIFIPESPGEYRIEAICRCVSGGEVSSPAVTIHVEELPEELRKLQGSEHVRF